MLFDRMIRLYLNEGYLKISQEVTDFLNKQFLPKIKETTLNYNGVLVFDIVKAAKTGDYFRFVLSEVDGKNVPYEFHYKIEYNNPKQPDNPIDVWIIYTDVRGTASALFSNEANAIMIYIPCVAFVGNNELASRLASNFKSKSFDRFSLAEVEKEAKQNIKDLKYYRSHMLKGATLERTISNIEHEFIHVLDPSVYQSKDNSDEALKKFHTEYRADYYGKPNPNSGKIPVEFNPMFWNMVRSFQVPLNDKTRKFLLDFIQNPQPVIDKLKQFDKEEFDLQDISNFILNLFRTKDKDYEAFMKILKQFHTRKLLIRIFEDDYLKKKFLQKLYLFVENS